MCFDRCCSGVCEEHIACGDIDGGWRCKGNLEVEELIDISKASLAGDAQCLGDGMCCENDSCNLCCSGTSHKTMASTLGAHFRRCGNAADFENITADMVV